MQDKGISLKEGVMKHSTESVDLRIKKFIDRKVSEYPELSEKNGPRVEVIQRGYLWEDFVSAFQRLSGAR